MKLVDYSTGFFYCQNIESGHILVWVYFRKWTHFGVPPSEKVDTFWCTDRDLIIIETLYYYLNT